MPKVVQVARYTIPDMSGGGLQDSAQHMKHHASYLPIHSFT